MSTQNPCLQRQPTDLLSVSTPVAQARPTHSWSNVLGQSLVCFSVTGQTVLTILHGSENGGGVSPWDVILSCLGKLVSCQPAPSFLQLSSSTLDSAVTALQAGQVHSHYPQATPTPTGPPNTPPASLDSFCKIPGLRSWAAGVLGWKQKSGLINYNTCALFQETPSPAHLLCRKVSCWPRDPVFQLTGFPLM